MVKLEGSVETLPPWIFVEASYMLVICQEPVPVNTAGVLSDFFEHPEIKIIMNAVRITENVFFILEIF